MSSSVSDRVRILNEAEAGSGPVVYWMQRDQRAEENWALLYAQKCALKEKQPLIVIFNMIPHFGEANNDHYQFMIEGLKESAEKLELKDIPFVVLEGDPKETIPDFVKKYKIGHLVTDFNPIRLVRAWKKDVAKKVSVCFSEVDAHNIVPCWIASDKEEFAAHTFRPKIHKKLERFLVDFPSLKKHQYKWEKKIQNADIHAFTKKLGESVSGQQNIQCKPGTKAGKKTAKDFFEKKLKTYNEKRNDPNADVLSDLSPYFHFGQVSAHWVALQTKKATGGRDNKDAFFEELVVRRELSDNFCFYNRSYDSFEGLRNWAKESLDGHRNDPREYLYSLKEFENAKTHDDLWNAAQTEMVRTGKMHGYMRMYWAKKILEWTQSPEEAIEIAVTLNDRYSLDGRDPNGYVGILWSIGGIHDRSWFDREIYGKIRYMNYNGCKRKFDVEAYIEKQMGQEALI